jgi:hypothetical protein
MCDELDNDPFSKDFLRLNDFPEGASQDRSISREDEFYDRQSSTFQRLLAQVSTLERVSRDQTI